MILKNFWKAFLYYLAFSFIWGGVFFWFHMFLPFTWSYVFGLQIAIIPLLPGILIFYFSPFDVSFIKEFLELIQKQILGYQTYSFLYITLYYLSALLLSAGLVALLYRSVLRYFVVKDKSYGGK